MMQQMMKAQMDHPGARGSFGKGSHVLLRQFRFPSEYNPNVDSFMTIDHDRIDHEHLRNVCQKAFDGMGEFHLMDYAKEASDGEILALLIALLRPDEHINWSGYRIMETTHRSLGYPVFTLQLFRNESGATEHSEPDSPNVLSLDDMDIDLNTEDRDHALDMLKWDKQKLKSIRKPCH